MRETKIGKKKHNLKFPEGFLWGSATSAYQVEGGIENNDWAISKRIPRAGKACDHYHRYQEDFDLAKQLNQNAHRLSLEWSRIEAKKGEWDEEALHHYFHVLEYLKNRGFQTFVTLHHFTNPSWIADQGGWVSEKTIEDFADFTTKIAQTIGQYIDFWITINEPNLYAVMTRLGGIFPPFEHNLPKTVRCYKNMLAAHNRAYQIIHAYYPRAQVGLAQNFSWRQPYKKSHFIDRLIVRFLNWIEYDYTYQRTRNDFIGVNHYFDTHVKFSPNPSSGFVRFERHSGDITTDRGWPIHPHGLYQVLIKLKDLKKPIYITENGLADAKDIKRKLFIKEYLIAVREAILNDADVRGYLHWSLLDNFEWEDGYKWKFGLVEVNFKTLERKTRDSALYYAQICKTNSLS